MEYLLPILVNLAILAVIWFAGTDWLRRNPAWRPQHHGHGHGDGHGHGGHH